MRIALIIFAFVAVAAIAYFIYLDLENKKKTQQERVDMSEKQETRERPEA